LKLEIFRRGFVVQILQASLASSVRCLQVIRSSALSVEMEKQKNKGRSLLGVLAFLGAYPGRVALCISLLLINISIEMAMPQIIGNAVTNLRWHLEWGAEFARNNYVLLFLSLVLIRAGMGHLLGPARNRLVQRTLGDVRSSIYNAMQRLSFSFHDRTKSGELISRSTTDVWRLQDFFFACLLMAVDIVVSLAATIWLVFLVSPSLALITVATAVPTAGLLAYYSRKLQPQWRKVHDLHSEMTTVLQENIAGVRVVKAFAKEAAEIKKFTGKRDVYLETMMRAVSYWSARVPLAQFIFGLALPLVLWQGGREVIRAEILLGDLITVIFYVLAIGNRMGSIGQFTSIIQNASASAERVLEIVDEPERIKSGNQKLPAQGGTVELRDVSFEYKTGKPSLRNVTFRAEAGQTYALVGPTGSGKSTLVHLIPRYYEASGGEILIDGINIRELDLLDLRRNVGIIFQDTFLFSASVAENIAYGKPDAPAAEIEQAARAAQAHEFIAELQDGYDTIIGERGITLSGGQKQRIAIARAFLMNPRFLIFDDATASVDSKTEHAIQKAIAELSSGRTTFVIAHRCSTVQHADRILVLKDGALVETGTHQELVARRGYYTEIFSQQLQAD
jgi:ABC-type multidrug transport system fused ATPase/permease subunit